jgi:N-acetylmuramoyl-L-alanine amidase
MRSLLATLFLAAWALGSAGRAAAAPAEVLLYGRNYVRLDQWAQEFGLKVKYTAGRKDFTVSGSAATLQFTVDSARVVFNGTLVYLAYPIAVSGGRPHVSSVDARKTLAPLLRPRRLATGQRVRTICIDAGHGGKEPGNLEGRHAEKTYTLLLAQELRRQLLAAGFNVVMTRTGDSYPELSVRPLLANQRGADVFLSLHFNSSGNAAAVGPEVFYTAPAGTPSTHANREFGPTSASNNNVEDDRNILLAYHLQRALVRGTGAPDRGVKRARFVVTRLADMPAALVEGGFMTNPADAGRIYSATGRQRMATAIVEGLRAYRKAVERPAPAHGGGTSSTSSSSSR